MPSSNSPGWIQRSRSMGRTHSGDEDIKQAVWSVIAEDDPQRVLDLIANDQAPREVLGLAMASMAARSPEVADAALGKLPNLTSRARSGRSPKRWQRSIRSKR